MNRETLLEEISYDLGMVPNNLESKSVFCSRLLYSAAVKTALVSLWDHEEDEEDRGSVSIIHVKSKVSEFIDILVSIYPELFSNIFCENKDDLIDDIIETLLEAGSCYHSQNYIHSAIYKEAHFNGVSFYRGTAPGSKYAFSGAGEYEFDNLEDDNTHFLQMFLLDEKSPLNYYDELLKKAEWKQSSIPDDALFLNVNNRLNGGYFMRSIDPSATISLMRFGPRGREIYCLYKREGSDFYLYQLPQYVIRTADGRPDYYWIMNGILMKNDKLPIIKTKIHTNTVTINIKTILPNRINSFFRLYSWPLLTDYSSFKESTYFIREMAKPVYYVFRDYLKSIGFVFEETDNG